mmetsp:Transcript_62146/g.196565  ORF Transcript_62146/g.196565 Transcript_62146/m.196565 type:complete len:273 (+) Transcript_62146:1546-2364(+)
MRSNGTEAMRSTMNQVLRYSGTIIFCSLIRTPPTWIAVKKLRKRSAINRTSRMKPTTSSACFPVPSSYGVCTNELRSSLSIDRKHASYGTTIATYRIANAINVSHPRLKGLMGLMTCSRYQSSIAARAWVAASSLTSLSEVTAFFRAAEVRFSGTCAGCPAATSLECSSSMKVSRISSRSSPLIDLPGPCFFHASPSSPSASLLMDPLPSPFQSYSSSDDSSSPCDSRFAGGSTIRGTILSVVVMVRVSAVLLPRSLCLLLLEGDVSLEWSE